MKKQNLENRAYYTAEQVINSDFYKFPKWLRYDEEFSKISNDAKVLYVYLLDLMELSIKNAEEKGDWIDEENRVYIRCSNHNICDLLNKSVNTSKKIFNELVSYNLVIKSEKFDKFHGGQEANVYYMLTPKVKKVRHK